MLDERPRSDVSDKYSWHCSNCKSLLSIRHKRFFSKSNLPLQKWLLMLYLWAREYPVTDAAEEAEISSRVVVDIYQWLREVCTNKLLQAPIMLGGPGVVVQIDESLFRHKPKVGRKNGQAVVHPDISFL